MKKTILSLVTLCLTLTLFSQDDKLVSGGQLMDYFLPIPNGTVTDKTWGDVVPRNIDNGIEDKEYSYWGGNIVLGDDGKYHMFPCRWKESSYKSKEKQGHRLWHTSEVVHAISDNLTGPYKVIEVVGKGHNPEIYRKKDGTYILAVWNDTAYAAKTLEGPWEKITPTFKVVKNKRNKTNRTYIVRSDGSVFLMNKSGHVFLSQNADEQFVEYDLPPVYHRSKGSHEEDPTIWKDEVNYNLIVNDATGRKAYHFTSPDGMKWQKEEGFAYLPTVVKHQDGTLENWWKLERPKAFTDKYGRLLSVNFAAIDCVKNNDLANDNHSSKNVVVPVLLSKRLQLLSKNGEDTFKIKILSEKGFNAIKDVDVSSLQFGDFTAVNYGKAAKATKSYADGKDLVVEFKAADTKLDDEDYKAKLLGVLKDKSLLWGKVRLTALPKPY